MKEMDHRDWRSFCLEKERVFDEILQLEQTGRIDSLDLRYLDENRVSLQPVHMFTNLKTLRLRFTTIAPKELSFFSHLERLDLLEVRFDTAGVFPRLNGLKVLQFAADRDADISFIRNCPALEHVVLKDTRVSDPSVFFGLKGLKTIQVEQITIEQETQIWDHIPGVTINGLVRVSNKENFK